VITHRRARSCNSLLRIRSRGRWHTAGSFVSLDRIHPALACRRARNGKDSRGPTIKSCDLRRGFAFHLPHDQNRQFEQTPCSDEFAKTASAKQIRIPSPSRFCSDPSSIYLDPLILLPYACLGHVCAADRFCRLIACQRCTVVTKVIGPLRHYFLPDWADELCHDGGWATDVGHSTNDHGAHVQEDFTA
jgi:hypothetical protein